jgi:hypothetical protein
MTEKHYTIPKVQPATLHTQDIQQSVKRTLGELSAAALGLTLLNCRYTRMVTNCSIVKPTWSTEPARRRPFSSIAVRSV